MIQDNACPVGILREEGLCGLSQCRKPDPQAEYRHCNYMPENRKMLVTWMKPICSFLPVP